MKNRGHTSKYTARADANTNLSDDVIHVNFPSNSDTETSTTKSIDSADLLNSVLTVPIPSGPGGRRRGFSVGRGTDPLQTRNDLPLLRPVLVQPSRSCRWGRRCSSLLFKVDCTTLSSHSNGIVKLVVRLNPGELRKFFFVLLFSLINSLCKSLDSGFVNKT